MLKAAYVDAIQRIERVSEKLLRPLPAVPQQLLGGQRQMDSAVSNMTQARYEEIVREAKEYIAAGDIFQVVLEPALQPPDQRPSVCHLPLSAHAQPVALYVLL